MPERTQETTCPFHTSTEFCTSRITLFKYLPLELQKSLVEHATHISKKKGSTIAPEGSRIDSIIIVRSGRIKTCRYDSDGEEQILDILHDGQAIWHGMFLQDNIYHYSIVAITDVTLCYISRESFMEIIHEHPEIAFSMMEMLSNELQDANEKAFLFRIKDPQKRLAQFLLFRDHRCLGKQINMKLDDIAASIALRPETVSRNITKLEKQGYIERIGQGKLVVKDREGLIAFSEN